MSRWGVGIKITVGVFVVAACALGIRSWARTWFVVDQFVVLPSSQFSAEQQASITSFFHDSPALKSADLAQISSIVRTQFPSIGHLDLAHDGSGLVTAQIDAVKPLCLINQDYILSSDGALIKKQVFEVSVLNTLVSLEVPQLDVCCCVPCAMMHKECVGRLQPALVATAQLLPNYVTAEYNVSCRNHCSWLLVDKREQRFAVLFHGSHIPDKKILARCAKLKGTLDARGAFAPTARRSWIADVRFENQIVLFENAGGIHG